MYQLKNKLKRCSVLAAVFLPWAPPSYLWVTGQTQMISHSVAMVTLKSLFCHFSGFLFFFLCFPLIPIVGVWEIQGHNHNFSSDLFHWWIISPLLKLMTISLLLGKNDFMSTGFSPWQFSPWATLDPFHPRCLHPFPEAAGACSYHCGNKGGYVHWHRSSAAPTLRPQTPGTLKDLVWSFWA